MAQHPAVGDAVSFAVADEMYGEDIGLAIVLKSNHTVTKEQIRQWIASKVARFKIPKQVSIPRVAQRLLANPYRYSSQSICLRQRQGKFSAEWLQRPCSMISSLDQSYDTNDFQHNQLVL